MRPTLIVILSCLAALAAGPLAAVPRTGDDSGLSVTVDADGAIRASGAVPPAFSLGELGERMPGIDLSAATQAETGAQTGGEGNAQIEAWERVLDALTVILPRLAEGEARFAGGRLRLAGTLLPGFSAEATRAAVRLALGAVWEAEIALAEAPPPAVLAVTWSRHGAVASGILPAGLAPEQALALLPEPAAGGLDDTGLTGGGTGLTGGGTGDPAAWRQALGRLGRLLPAFRHAAVRLAEEVPGRGTLAIEGGLAPGHDAQRLGGWLAAELVPGWEVSLAGTGTPAAEGATRLDPVSGTTQRLVRGSWLPLHDFPPGRAACARRAAAILAEAPLGFVPGEAALAEEAAPVLDRLAGLARHCLNQGGLGLAIGGHTDSRGDDAENLALSARRAMTVLLELVARGVRADAMTAVGYGATRAIAGNDSEQGRARNRRIGLAWSG
ncbi:MAG TPA: OmpA family protein [Thermohalobaculum sp.]|nr:OmpA family protein [Thermohalobaculum sp.]